MELVIATNNKNKLKEIRAVLNGKFDKLLSLADVGLEVDVEETGKTFFDNALLKATAVGERISLPVLADDSGLVVEALGGAPGVYSARYAGEPCDHAKNNEKLLSALKDKTNRNAAFTTTVVLRYPDGSYLTASGSATGKILTEARGENGFGYDPVFYSDDLGCTFAEATPEQKNSVSHRARALHNLQSVLK